METYRQMSLQKQLLIEVQRAWRGLCAGVRTDGFECAMFTRQQLPPHRVATASDGATEAYPQSCCMHEGLTGQHVQGYPAHNQQGFHRALGIVLL